MMPNIINYEENATQNHNEVSFLPSHTTRWLSLKEQIMTSAGEVMEKMEILYPPGGNVKWCSCFGKQIGSSSKG